MKKIFVLFIIFFLFAGSIQNKVVASDSGNSKIIVYQMMVRLFGNQNTTCKFNGTLSENGCGKMNDIDSKILHRIKSMGVTHIWFTGVLRHASVTDYSEYGIPLSNPVVVKGNAGSPYAISDYYDIDPDLAENVNNRKQEFLALLQRAHNAGLKVIIDFVPNHVARQYHSVNHPEGVKDLGENDIDTVVFKSQNNFYYCPNQKFQPQFDLSYDNKEKSYYEYPAKASGNDVFNNHPTKDDWYETVKLNYGVEYKSDGSRIKHFSPLPDTWSKMTDIMLYWLSLGVDGFRCDMAEMVPVEFWQWATAKVRKIYPKTCFIGEIYNPKEYENYINTGGFDYLYDKVGLYDTLKTVVRGERPASSISLAVQNVNKINRHMLNFLENHDEQRIASGDFAGNPFKAIPALMVSALSGGNPFMLYAGEEFGEKGSGHEGFGGEDGRTTIFDYWCVPAIYAGYFNPSLLTAEQRSLYSDYSKVLCIAHDDRAVSDGSYMYLDNSFFDKYDKSRQYSFLRKTANEILFVTTNFSSANVIIDFTSSLKKLFLNNKGKVTLVDLISKDKIVIKGDTTKTLKINIPPYSGKIYRINL